VGKSITSAPWRAAAPVPQDDVLARPSPPSFASDANGELEATDRPTSIPTVPRAAWPVTCELLARMALDSASRGDSELARRAAADAHVMVAALAASGSRACRSIAADAALTLGDALLILEDAVRAESCFESAARFYDTTRDRSRASAARIGLARAFTAMTAPAAKTPL
jgi:hypothetical protein